MLFHKIVMIDDRIGSWFIKYEYSPEEEDFFDKV